MTALEAYHASPQPSQKHTTYFDIYDQIFSKYQNKKITFVEVGVQLGGSLFMWQKYFGDKARIIGIDLNPDAKKWEKDGFEIYIGSQSDPNFWKEFVSKVGPIDILLDDGGHTYIQQIITTETLLEKISDGGVLVVEDTHTSYMEGYGDRNYSFINYVKAWIEIINTRFGAFNKKQEDVRVWSLEVFESIVAFKINKKASKLESKPVWNIKPKKDKPKDYWKADQTQIKKNQENIKSIISKAFSIYKDS
jgi:hypothetical protein